MTGLAAEGGSSLYIPGAAGGIVMALPGEPGWTVSDAVFVGSAHETENIVRLASVNGRCCPKTGLAEFVSNAD